MTESMGYFDRQLSERPEQVAIRDARSQRSWRELNARVNTLAHHLRDGYRLRPGQHIALLVGNRIEFVEALLAGMLVGLWVTPINTHLSAPEVAYIVEDCGAALVVCEASLADLLEGVTGVTVLDVDRLEQRLGPLVSVSPVHKDAPAGGAMLYTSGTTGQPKGVKRANPATVGAMIERFRTLGASIGLDGQGVHLVTGPLYHAAPGLYAVYDMLGGAAVVIMDRWDCATFLRLVEHYQVRATHLVPTMFVRLLEHRDAGRPGSDADLSSLHRVMHGAAPIAREVKRRMIDWWGPILREYWGSTEAGTISIVDSDEWLLHPGTVGRALPHYEVYIGDEQGNPLTDATEGLLFSRHRQLEQAFLYHNAPEKTAQTHPQPYTFCIGDIGRVDAEGYIYLSDRQSNMIISGGVNIYPAEVEQALSTHPDVVDVAVFGVPDAEWGEQVRALVQLREGVTPDAQTIERLQRYARALLAGFKVPRSVKFIDEIPRTPTGKALVRELRRL